MNRRRQALEHLRLLVPGDGAALLLLERIVDRLEQAEFDPSGFAEFHFGGRNPAVLRCYPPDDEPAASLPDDLQRVLRVHASLEVERVSGMLELHDGSRGVLHALGEDAGLDQLRDGFAYSRQLVAPLDVGLQDFYVYHPHATDSNGQPLLLLKTHNDLGAKRVDERLGALFLKHLWREISFDDWQDTAPAPLAHELYFGGRRCLFDDTELKVSAPQEKSLERLARLTRLTRLELSDLGPVDLRPLSGLTGMKELKLQRMGISNLWPLEPLKQLEALGLLGCRAVRELDVVSTLPNLTALELDLTRVEDLRPLSGLARLERLSLRGTPVRDLAPLRLLWQLRELRLEDTEVPQRAVDELVLALPQVRVSR